MRWILATTLVAACFDAPMPPPTPSAAWRGPSARIAAKAVPSPPNPAACDPNNQPMGITRDIIVAGIAPVRIEAAKCGALAPGATGVVKVHVRVGPGGLVTNAVAAASPDPDLGECVAAAARKATFACTRHGGSFSYPIPF